MPPKTLPLKFKRTINAPPLEVYRAFTHGTHLREWLSDGAYAESHKGGRIFLWWNSGFYASGEFTALEAGKKIAFTWAGRREPGATKVSVSLAAKNGGTVVTLTHSGVGKGKAWAKTIKGIERGWERGLENLQSVMETGHDLRFTLRPMLGIMGGEEVNPELAARQRLPVEYGVRLNGVVDGMGAQAAGLQKDDVIVAMGGKKVIGWTALLASLQLHRAGDTIPVTFYRGNEKKTLPMTLSRRPLPDAPDTAERLAEFARQMVAEFDAELGQCFEGATEEEAARRPAPEEWSAREVVAHLLAGERDGHSYLTEIVDGNERTYDQAYRNSMILPRVVAEAYPTVAAMLADLTRMEAETVALFRALPPEFVARKASFWRFAYGITQAPVHNDDHLQQIRAAIAAARK